VLNFVWSEYILKLQLIFGYTDIIVLTTRPTPQAITVKYFMTARTYFDVNNKHSPPSPRLETD